MYRCRQHLDYVQAHEAAPVEQLLHLCGTYLRLFASQPELSRVLMRVMAFSAPRPGSAPPAAHGQKLLEVITRLLMAWRERGWLRSDVDLGVAAVTLASVQVGHIIALLSGVLASNPQQALPAVLNHLEGALALTLRGMLQPEAGLRRAGAME